jgi:MerR family mercuric resistance operon transcriptional regulator/MerR family copper efflux transcriptional regulator
MPRLTIGELAKRAGVGVETVRYYQRRGLFAEPPRVARATREYTPEALELLRFIRRARGLGFTIREVERLVALRRSRKDTGELLTMLATKAVELERQVTETREVIRTLDDMAARCGGLEPLDRWQLFDEVQVPHARVTDVE